MCSSLRFLTVGVWVRRWAHWCAFNGTPHTHTHIHRYHTSCHAVRAHANGLFNAFRMENYFDMTTQIPTKTHHWSDSSLLLFTKFVSNAGRFLLQMPKRHSNVRHVRFVWFARNHRNSVEKCRNKGDHFFSLFFCTLTLMRWHLTGFTNSYKMCEALTSRFHCDWMVPPAKRTNDISFYHLCFSLRNINHSNNFFIHLFSFIDEADTKVISFVLFSLIFILRTETNEKSTFSAHLKRI